MNNCFLTVGTKNIKTELMRTISDVTITKENAKPNGGLWLTDYNLDYQNVNSWMDNITSFNRIDSLYNTKYYGPNKLAASAVFLKKDANIFILDSEEKFNELLEKFPHESGLFSYELLSKEYDGIYIDLLKIPHKYFNAFINFDVSSLILFNTKPIDYYQEAVININSLEHFYGDILYPSDYTINLFQEKKYIKNNTEEYEKLVNELASIIKKHWYYNKDKYSQDMRSYFIFVYDYITNNYYDRLQNIVSSDQDVNDLCFTITCNVMPKK